MLKLFIPALLGIALLAPTAQAKPASAFGSSATQISRDSGYELVATKKKVAKKPAAKKMAAPKKKAAKPAKVAA
jgi:hypothetical protein